MEPLHEPTSHPVLEADHLKRHAIKDALVELIANQPPITLATAQRHHGWKLEKLLLGKGYAITALAPVASPVVGSDTGAGLAEQVCKLLDEARRYLQQNELGRVEWALEALLDPAHKLRALSAPTLLEGEGGAGKWLDPNRGPRSEWQDTTQILHPVLVAREGAEEAELAYWCDMNDEWLTFQRGERQRIDDVEGWQPLPALPKAPTHAAR